MSDIDHKADAEALMSASDDSGKPTTYQMEGLIAATLYAAEQQHIANQLVAANILMMRVQRGHELKPSEWAIVHAATEQFEGGI